MSLIDKAYFTLEEIEERWQLPHRDLAYLGENGLLRLSVRVFGVHMEFGFFEEGADGEWFRVAQDRCRFTGLQDLLERDVFRLFREGQVEVGCFHAPEREYRDLLEPTETVCIRPLDLLVRREERDRSSRSIHSFAKARAHCHCNKRMIIARCARPDFCSISGPCRRVW
jgi:hypothetical protein